MLAPIARMRSLENAFAPRLPPQRTVPQPRATAAARAGGAGVPARRSSNCRRSPAACSTCRTSTKRAGRRGDRRHRPCRRCLLHGQRQRFRHRCRRAAALRARQDAAGAGTGVENKPPYVQLVESAGANRCATASRICPRRQHLRNLARSSGGWPVGRHGDYGSSTAGGANLTGFPLHRDGAGRTAPFSPTATARRHRRIAIEKSRRARCTPRSPGSATTSPRTTATPAIARYQRRSWSGIGQSRRNLFLAAAQYDAEELLGIMPMDHSVPSICARRSRASSTIRFHRVRRQLRACHHLWPRPHRLARHRHLQRPA